MVEDFIQVQPDSTGKKLRAIKQTVAGNDVESEVVVLSADGSNTVDPTSWPDVTATGTLAGAAQNVQIALQGRFGVSCFVGPGLVTSNIQFDVSNDGGATWFSAVVFDVSAQTWILISSSVNRLFLFSGIQGQTHARVRVASFGSGSSPVTLKATVSFNDIHATAVNVKDTAPGVLRGITVFGFDGTNVRALTALNADPVGTEYGAIARALIYGDQNKRIKQNPTTLETVTDPVDRDARVLGRTKVWDGTNFLPTMDSVARAGFHRMLLGNKSTYASSSNGTLSLGTLTAGAVNSLCYLFHPSANTKRFQMTQLVVSVFGGSAGDYELRLGRITAENATPGGTSQTIIPKDQADAASTGVFRTGATGAPTRDTSRTRDFANAVGTNLFNQPLIEQGSDVVEGKPHVMRASVAEGWELTCAVGTAITTSPKFALFCEWTEE